MPFKTRGSPAAAGTVPDPVADPAWGGDSAVLAKTPAAGPAITRRTHTCPKCGKVLNVSGMGRHRVFFELTDEVLENPVMNRVCPGCGDRLPGK